MYSYFEFFAALQGSRLGPTYGVHVVCGNIRALYPFPLTVSDRKNSIVCFVDEVGPR